MRRGRLGVESGCVGSGGGICGRVEDRSKKGVAVRFPVSVRRGIMHADVGTVPIGGGDVAGGRKPCWGVARVSGEVRGRGCDVVNAGERTGRRRGRGSRETRVDGDGLVVGGLRAEGVLWVGEDVLLRVVDGRDEVEVVRCGLDAPEQLGRVRQPWTGVVSEWRVLGGRVLTLSQAFCRVCAFQIRIWRD